MSETTLATSQTADAALAADERLATKEGRSQFWRATFSCWLGTAMEYVDFALYGLAAGMVFGDVFFPEATPLVALLASFATYSVGFVARPIGALVFGWIGDRKGRRVVLITTVALMGLHHADRPDPVLCANRRLGAHLPGDPALRAGFGAGAELSGGAVMLAEYAPAKRRGLVASIIAIGSNSGTLLASLVWLLVLQLDKEDLMSWGWRIPFLASILIAGVALYLRRHVRETPVFERELQQNHQRMLDAAQATPDTRSYLQRTKAFWVMLGLRIGENGPSYLCQGFIVGYVAKVLMVDKSVPALAVLIASLCGFLVIPLAGWLSDRFGRRVTYRWFCLLLVLYAFPAFWLLDSREPAIVISVIVVGMCIASLGIFGVQAAYGVELFGVKNRYSKMAFAKELGSILSGGTAPLIATALLSGFGHWWPVAAYFVVMAGIGLITTFFAPETRGRDLNLPQDAA